VCDSTVVNLFKVAEEVGFSRYRSVRLAVPLTC